ncbi:pantoate--beta-alanine ligase [Catenovulum sp. 2E275]|uniref:pantoate--beta-alanine ligase n=1 Tax=Catenovulum sp. 2E275 TaxID=2980497 RepID=UPI0021D151BB|nr:pantoate--beta-alanine ligase [Catenovulum sp. 2E275]MCU4675498.1 pantoate--beta-alanine ligase [Catenovulum sp. 2E275]
MQTIEQISVLRQQISDWKKQGYTIGFVPTMGNLHQGHLSLVEEAKKHADKIVVSIFVNPMQFGKNEDLDKYPRTLEADSQALIAAQVDLLFTPTPQIIYPKGLDNQTWVEVPHLSELYCGDSRPGHFRGVTTIVNKLFNLVQPDIACFGEKDFQQLALIKTMVEDLSIPIKIIGVPTVRETSGLAKSSRNGYLSEAEKQQAAVIYQNLTQLKNQLEQGDKNFAQLIVKTKQNIYQAGLTTDYVWILDSKTLQPADKNTNSIVILIAAFLGSTRLIDNIQVKLK